MTKGGKSGNKAVYNYTNEDFVVTKGRHSDLWPHKSFMQQDKVFITWYDGTRWQIYKMKTTDISMLIILHMQSKRKSYIVRNVLFYLGNYDFQRSKGGFMFFEKYYYFIYVSSGMYSMTICEKSGIKTVHNYKNKDYVITRGRQHLTSTSTPSGPLTS